MGAANIRLYTGDLLWYVGPDVKVPALSVVVTDRVEGRSTASVCVLRLMDVGNVWTVQETEVSVSGDTPYQYIGGHAATRKLAVALSSQLNIRAVPFKGLSRVHDEQLPGGAIGSVVLFKPDRAKAGVQVGVMLTDGVNYATFGGQKSGTPGWGTVYIPATGEISEVLLSDLRLLQAEADPNFRLAQALNEGLGAKSATVFPTKNKAV